MPDQSEELCGETRPGAMAVRCGLAKGHGGGRHIPDPIKPNAGWWRTAPKPVFPPDRCESRHQQDGEEARCERPGNHNGFHAALGTTWGDSALVCAAALHLGKDNSYPCTLPQGHSERHEDSDGSEWDITWTRPQSERMDAPAPPLTFSRDQRLRALEEFQDAATSRLEALEEFQVHVTGTLLGVGERLRGLEARTAPGVPFATEKPSTVVYGVSQHEWDRVTAKLDRILERLGPPDVERCSDVRPYSRSHGRSGEPNPDDMCVRPEGHTNRHVNGTITWPNTAARASSRCGVKHPESGHPCWKVVGPSMQPHTEHRTVYGSVWEAARAHEEKCACLNGVGPKGCTGCGGHSDMAESTHEEDCERGPEHDGECCSHPNGVGPNGCAGCGDYRPDEPDDPKCVNGCQRANGHDGICCGHSGGTGAFGVCSSGCGDRLT